MDHATPNLPSRQFAATVAFYSGLGFGVAYRSEGWLILERRGLTLEFFPYPDLDPACSSFGCCLRLDSIDPFVAQCRAAGVPETTTGWPRLHPPSIEPSGMRIAYLVDPDGTLLRLVENPAS